MEINDYFSPTYEVITRLRSPEKLYISSRGIGVNDVMDEIIRDINSRIQREESLTVNQMCEMFRKPVIKTEKETKKMEAKKCDRCGKLYEMPGTFESGSGARVRFKFDKVYKAEEKSGTKIAEEQMKDIYIKYGHWVDKPVSTDGCVDFCPDCRASLKKWFENPEKEGK